MNEKTPQLARNSPASDFKSDAWENIVVTDSGEVVQKSAPLSPSNDAVKASHADVAGRKHNAPAQIVPERTERVQEIAAQQRPRQAPASETPVSVPRPSRRYEQRDTNEGHRSRRGGRTDELPKRATMLLRYPFVGDLVRCTDRGFGFLRHARGESMAHIRENVGHALQTMQGLEGKYCAFAIGGSPSRYTQQKPDWDRAVVQWILLDEIDPELTPESYQLAREAELASVDKGRLFNTLAAEWYVRTWEQKAREQPKALLIPDALLDSALNDSLSHCSDLEGCLRLLGAIVTSPYYAVEAAGRQNACKRFFHPDKWDLRAFIASRPVEECRFYADVWPLCGAVIQDRMNHARTVAIDIEAENGRIWQYGWKNAGGTGLKSMPEDIPDADLTAAVQESLLSLHSPCIVGHNLLSWDLPRLRERRVAFPERAEYWDTLIASWILRPWVRSHALIVDDNGHRADADASKCYELFEAQTAMLAACMRDACRDIGRLIDDLFEGRITLSSIPDRHYPADLSAKIGALALYPRNRMRDVAWQEGCYVDFMTPESRMKDPVLSPATCALLAREHADVRSKALAIIVTDAAEHKVQVRLSMIPSWLVDATAQARLREAHKDDQSSADNNADHRICVAEDLFAQPWESSLALMREQKLVAGYPYEVLLAWQSAYSRILREGEAQIEFPSVIEGRTGRAAFVVDDKARGPSWLLYEPPGLGQSDPSWQLLPPVPDELSIAQPASSASRDLPHWAALPRWRDGDVTSLDVDRLFVSPDTANRKLYLADVVHVLLNLLRTLPQQHLLVCAMRWPSEAAEVQNALTLLSLSVLHADTPLRQIERLRNEGLRVIACSQADIPRYVEAAQRFGQGVRIAVDELPLHAWHCILNTPVEPSRDSGEIPNDSAEEDAEDDGSEDADNNADVAMSQAAQVPLKARDLYEASSLLLGPWLASLLQMDTAPENPVLILDSRLFNQPSARSLGLQREDVPFYPLDELLDEGKRDVYDRVCFPRRAPEDIPNDYESYRNYLEKNWGYAKFLPGTQQPAIEALVSTQHDLLLRLPTGAGKSEVFQVPALLRAQYSGRLSVVITPLRALMQDQVHRLWRRGFREEVDYLSGGREAWVNYDVYQGVLDGRVKLLYVAPERFRVPRFTEAMELRRRMDGGLEFLVFDEVHCVSEWGFEFRPDYLYAAQYVADWFRKMDLPGNPHRVLMLSATVTKRNQHDLERELRLPQPPDYDDLPRDMPHPIQPFIILESCELPETEELSADDKFSKILEILGKLDLAQSGALVFVRKREDCHRISEALNAAAAASGSAVAHLHSLPFHAGLPETVKSEACDLLKARTVNVLVCTKAFGMGMDVPHLHACIHYRPPTFIEDYLQEVGRIGRSKEERERTGHEQVTATLLFNHDNLEHNLGMLHDKAVKPPDLQDFFGYCLDRAVPFKQVGKAVCIVPAALRINEAKSFDENQVTNCLFWLERMSVLRVEGRHPPFLDLTLRLSSLRKISATGTDTAVVARALLSLVEETSRVVVDPEVADSSPASKQAAESAFSRFIRGLVRGVLALVSSPAQTSSVEDASARATARQIPSPANRDNIDVSVSMSEIMASSGGIGADDLFSRLIALSQANALSLRKTFVVLRSAVPSDKETYWPLLRYAVERLLRPTEGAVELLSRKAFEVELKAWYQAYLRQRDPPKDIEASAESGVPVARSAETPQKRRIQREVYRAIGGSLKLVRYAGLRMKESLASDGTMQYARAIPDSSIAEVKRGISERLDAMQRLVAWLAKQEPQAGGGQAASFDVALVDLVNALGQETRVSRLRELMNLTEASGFYGLENKTDEWVSVVSLNTMDPLPPHVSETESAKTTSDTGTQTGSDLIQSTYVEMLKKHELQVLRAQCMVLFAAMPTENRKQFIDRYFQCLTAEDLQSALEDAVGEVGDEILAGNQMLQDLLVQVRRERFGKEMDRLNDEQRAVCAAPFNRKLLVNAGPGSGKTHVLMMRCAHLIHAQNIRPSEILVLAFNRAVVFEIRDRIRDLFRELGYGSHVRSLDVSTFHSFALRNQPPSDMYEEDAIGEAVHRFAQSVSTDTAFARRIAGGYKAILVDEFQDMNEDFYDVVQALVTHCQDQGGAMVIGDDDQDILTWNRKKWRDQHRLDCPLEAVHYFDKYRQAFTPDLHALPLNYRSVPEIVSRANGMIAKASERLHFTRMKAQTTLAAFRTENGAVTLPFDANTLGDILLESMSRQASDGKSESIAILCRSNRECRKVHEQLSALPHIHDEWLEILGAEDFALYQLRPTGAMLDMCTRRDQWEFVEPYTWDSLLAEYQALGHADMAKGIEDLRDMYQLMRLERGRPRMRDVVDFVQEMRASDIERLKTRTGISARDHRITISTVHKVKGLEYDTVVVLPSSERFPLNDSNGGEVSVADAAEEARLCYVAMTRARNRLYVGWPQGGREPAWWSSRPFEGVGLNGSYTLKGSPKEIFVSWTGQTAQVEQGLQDYIEQHVNAGDEVELRYGRAVYHQGRKVGILSRRTADALNNGDGHVRLRVANVIRYSCGKYFEEHNHDFWQELHQSVKQRRWFYVVLPEAG